MEWKFLLFFFYIVASMGCMENGWIGGLFLAHDFDDSFYFNKIYVCVCVHASKQKFLWKHKKRLYNI